MTCTTCQQEKPVEAFDTFVLHANGRTYTRRQCRACRGAKTRAYLAKQRESQREDRVVLKVPSLLQIEPEPLRLQVATEIVALLRRPRRIRMPVAMPQAAPSQS